jgi:nicotinate-nucleotide pyrophosphorylase (carboxylating)
MPVPDPLPPAAYRDLIARAIVEDVGAGDVTTLATVPPGVRGAGTFLVKRACTIAGLDVARAVFAAVDATVRFDLLAADGDTCAVGTVIASVSGPAASLLTAERIALNFLQRMSGIATLTRRFVDAAAGRITIIDTRKTTPTLRALEKYAVRCGGATSNRFGLFDAVLIKDNHVRVAGGIGPAVSRARAAAPALTIEVETQSLEEVVQAVAAGADIIMLDNLSEDEMREAVKMIDGRARVELSGGVTLERMPALAAIGADTVSVGAITHSAPAADISLEIECSIPSPATSPTR